MAREHKYCIVCGRRMTWRRRWRNDWENVRYCSTACRRKGLNETDRKLESAIVDLMLQQRAGDGFFIEDVAAKVSGNVDGKSKMRLIQAARNAARRLHNQRSVDILQNGRRVDPSTAKGPFLIRRRNRG